MDINSTRTHVVLAGNKILKTLRLNNDDTCTEEYDVREAASNTQDITAAQRDTFEIEDVAWSRDNYKDFIATAARNGKIMLYNISRPDVQIGRLHDHLQQVHKVDFSPIEGESLLSASQDGTVRLWDLRNLQHNSMVCSSKTTYHGRSDSVRHAKWSPTDTWSFAFCTDSGYIQKWDIRNNSGPLMKFSAHYQTCNSIDWHPDGKHLVSAGKDQDVNVWSMVGEVHRQRPIFTLRAPYPVQNVRWRLPCFVQDYHDQTYKQCTNLATSYREHPVIHVWDLRRPLIPFREIRHQRNGGTHDMLWRSKDLLWSVGPQGEFSQVDVPRAAKSVDRRPMSTMAIAPTGESALFIKRRPTQQRSESPQARRSSSFRDLPIEERLPFGRSPAEDSFEDHFLMPGMSGVRHHSRTPSVRSARSFGTTPPTIDDISKINVISFDDAISLYPPFHDEQVAKTGLMVGHQSPLDTTYLAQKYKQASLDLELDVNYMLAIRGMVEQNTTYCQRASRYRDAQTWKIFGGQLDKELRQRAEINRRNRRDTKKFVEDSLRMTSAGRSRATSLALPHARGSLATSPNIAASSERSSIVDPANLESLARSRSTTPTLTRKPMRRPLSRLNSTSTITSRGMLDMSSHLTSPTIEPPTSSHSHVQSARPDSKYHKHANAFLPLTENRRQPSDAEEKILSPLPSDVTSTSPDQQTELWHPTGRLPLKLDDLQARQHDSKERPPKRHDSTESFEMFSTSSDSEPKLSKQASFASNTSGLGDDDDDDISSTVRRKERSDPLTVDDMFVQAGSPPRAQRPSYLDTMRKDMDKTHSPDRLPTDIHVSAEPSSRIDESVSTPRSLSRNTESKDPDVVSESVPADKHGRRPFRSEDASPITLKLPSTPPLFVPRKHESPSPPVYDQPAPDTDFSITDFLDIPEAAPTNFINATEMLQRLLIWYIDHGDAQMAANLFLLSAPLLAPPGTPLPNATPIDDALEATYHETLTSQFLAFTSEAATSIIETHHRPLQAILGIPPICAEAILSTYHEQLLQLNTLNPACQLRNLCYPTFPAVYEQGLKDVEIGIVCKVCNSPINNPWNKLKCETCDTKQAECPICMMRESPYELPGGKKKKAVPPPSSSIPAVAPPNPFASEEDTAHPDSFTSISNAHSRRTLFSACPICNHSAHAACANMWFSDTIRSGGGCFQSGCLCDCTRGRYRDEIAAMEKDRQAREKEKSSVSSEGGIRGQRGSVAKGRGEAVAFESAARRGSRTGQTQDTARGQGTSGITAMRGALKTTTSMNAGSNGTNISGSGLGRSFEKAGAGPLAAEAAGRSSFEGKRVRVVAPGGSAEV